MNMIWRVLERFYRVRAKRARHMASVFEEKAEKFYRLFWGRV